MKKTYKIHFSQVVCNKYYIEIKANSEYEAKEKFYEKINAGKINYPSCFVEQEPIEGSDMEIDFIEPITDNGK